MEATLDLGGLIETIADDQFVKDKLKEAFIKAMESEHFQQKLSDIIIDNMESYIDWGDLLSDPIEAAINRIDFQKIIKSLFKQVE
mgnify:CR=1 FL=1